MAGEAAHTVRSIRAALIVGAAALVRAGDAVVLLTKQMRRGMHNLVHEARDRARANRATRREPRQTAGREVPQATRGEVPRTSEPAQATAPTARAAKRRGAKKGRSKKRS